MPGVSVITPTGHCIERFHERVRPALSAYVAASELFRLMATFGEFSPSPPGWAADATEAEGWLLLGEDIALPLRDGRAISCLTRSGYSESERDYHTRAKRRARSARRSAGSPDTKALKRERKGQRAAGRRWEAA